MILTEGDHFWMSDNLEPHPSGNYEGRTVWMVRRVPEAASTQANSTKVKFTEINGSAADLLSIHEVMKELGMGKSWTYRRIKNGEIPSIRFGGVYKVKRGDLHQWVEGQRV